MTMASEPNGWMPQAQWDALVRGEQCPLCRAYHAGAWIDAYGSTIADLLVSRLRLAANQWVPGYCVLMCATHVREPYHLPVAARTQFFEDLLRAAQALEQVFQPVKMNITLLGNAIPHLHAHLIPRYYGDPAPGMPIDPGAQEVWLTPAAYAERVRLIQAAL